MMTNYVFEGVSYLLCGFLQNTNTHLRMFPETSGPDAVNVGIP